MKTAVCTSSSTTLANKAATAVDFTVKTMTYGDQCAFTVNAKCDLPVVTLTTATGGFLSTNNKVAVEFIEGTSETLSTTDMPYQMGENASMGKQGSFYPVWNTGVTSEVGPSALEISMGKYLTE